MILPLQLTPEQQTQLLATAERFNGEMERHRPPLPNAGTLSQLKVQLQEVLNAQQGFAEFWEKSAYQHENSQLRIVHESTAVRNLPWQLALEGRSQVAVCKSTEVELPAFRPTTGYPLKVLVMVAAPDDVTELNYEKEEQELLTAFSPLMEKGLVEVHFTDDGSLENMGEKLLENRYHILHYSGHGSYEGGEGFLALEDPNSGRLHKAGAAEVNEVFREAYQKGHRPDLVLLSACQTAQGVEESNLSGMANVLLQGGTPAVVAMSTSILDVCATYFAAALYEQLAKDFTLGYAFQRARLAMRDFEVSRLNPAQHGLEPGQWLIPQLLLSQEVEHLVDNSAPRTELNFKQETAYATGQQGLLELRVRPKNYVFVGRRKEKREALQMLKEGKAVLLRGQGGMGKTALAEHLAIRVLAGNPRTKVFTHSEQQPAAQSLLDQLRDYLTKEQRKTSVVTALQEWEKLTDKFLYLLEQVGEYCDPLFVFDNIESFQNYDQEKGEWAWNLDEHEDVFTVLQCLKQYTDFPIILTGRYPLAEFPDCAQCDLNAAPFGDFFKKCWQLSFSELAAKLEKGEIEAGSVKRAEEDTKTTFRDVAALLHKSLGGNYRALEFFDELYKQDKEGIEARLGELSKLQDRIKESDVLQRMSRDLIFQQLLSFLDEEDKDTLGLLSYFRIPVLPMAIGFQREAADRSTSLSHLSNLTLLEKQNGADQRDRYYVTPLVKELLDESDSSIVPFNAKQAGAYHEYVLMEQLGLKNFNEFKEAFEWYYMARDISGVNRLAPGALWVGAIEVEGQYINYSLRTEKLAGNKTSWQVLKDLGEFYDKRGDYSKAKEYFKKILKNDNYSLQKEDDLAIQLKLASISKHLDEPDQALFHLEKGLPLSQEIGDQSQEIFILSELGIIYTEEGNYDLAENFLEKALSLSQENDGKTEVVILNHLAGMNVENGRLGKAIHYLDEALSKCQINGDRKGEGYTLYMFSLVHHTLGEDEQALECLKQFLLISREVSDLVGVALASYNLTFRTRKVMIIEKISSIQGAWHSNPTQCMALKKHSHEQVNQSLTPKEGWLARLAAQLQGHRL